MLKGKARQNRVTHSLEIQAGFTFWKKVENSSVTSPWAALFLSAISSMVSCKNLAISSFTLSSFFRRSSCRAQTRSSEMDHGEEQKYDKDLYYDIHDVKGKRTFLDCVSKVDGSMFGKSFSTTGSRNSINGTMMKTRKGRRRKTSAHVLKNCD